MKKSKCLKPPGNRVKDRQEDTSEYVVLKLGEMFRYVWYKYIFSYIIFEWENWRQTDCMIHMVGFGALKRILPHQHKEISN